MTPSSYPAMAPRNALMAPGTPPAKSTQSAARTAPRAALLANTIGHAAVLSDTPEKWASTIAMLRQNGVDPEGYEDFENGRPAAISAAGVSIPQGDQE